tara:strand:- start:680 stop:2752 length:2073 start_codon:yes stop_codon:yes gene_type:complete
MTPREELNFLRKEKRYAELMAKSEGGVTTNPAPEPDAPWQEDVKGFVRQVGSGATFGLSDRFADGMQSFENDVRESFGFDPSENTKTSKQLRDQFAEQHPLMSAGASLAGGIVNPIARATGNWAMAGKSLPAQMIKSSGVGAGLGGAQAIGESEGPLTERLKAGKDAAIIGGVVGPLVPAAIKAGSNALGGLRDQIARLSPQMQLTQASRLMNKAISDDGYTMESALKKLRELGPESTLADLGDNTRSVLRSVYDRGGEGAQKVAQYFSKRQGGSMIPEGQAGSGLQTGHAAGRVEGMIDDLGFGKYHDKRLLDKLQEEATDLYNKAYSFPENQVVNNTKVNELLNRDGMSEVMAKAREGMRLRGENVSLVNKELTSLGRDQGITTGKGIGEGLKLKFLDKVKRVLYDMEEGERDSITGRLTDKGGAWNEVRRELTKALDEADSTGFYAQARAKAGDKLSSEQARRSGNNFISKSEFADEQTMADELAEMSEHELQNFRIGVANALKRKVGAKRYKSANAPDALKGDDALERKIKVAFGDETSFFKFKNQLLAEDELHKTYTKLGQTQTSKNLGSAEYAAKNEQIMQGLQNMALNRPVRGTIDVAMGLKDKFFLPENMSGELADLLTSRNLTPIQQQYKAQIMNQLKQNKISGGLLAGSSGPVGASGEPVNVRVDSNTRRSLANQLMQGR